MKTLATHWFYGFWLAAAFGWLSWTAAAGPTLTALHGFNPYGGTPQGIILSSNVIYGVAQSGGDFNYGGVFRVGTNGLNFTNIYSFTEPHADPQINNNTNGDGASPMGELVLSGNTLYGTTQSGGGAGGGTVFAVNIDGAGFTNLHSFTVGIPSYTNIFGDAIYTNGDGAHPAAGLVLADGTLYGTAETGGGAGNGTLFRINTDGSGFGTLHSFTSNSVIYDSRFYGTNRDGANPVAAMILSADTLYGTTKVGGGGGMGTVFAIRTNGIGFTNLYTFTASSSIYSDGTNADGILPEANLTLANGVLYGTTSVGGPAASGTIFKLGTNGADFTTLYSFPEGFGDSMAGLTLAGSTLYGTTFSGGTNQSGSVFKLNLSGGGFSNIYNFTVFTNGVAPAAAVVIAGGTVFGTVSTGGALGEGAVFAMSTNGKAYSRLYSFPGGKDGGPAMADLLLSGSLLYGTTQFGGAFGGGTVFRMGTNGTGYTNIYSFSGENDGANLQAGLIESGGRLYGTAQYGGKDSDGVLFAVGTNGLGYVNVHSFAGVADGANPLSTLVLSGNTLYGTTQYGGASNNGTIFRVNTNGMAFTNLHNFKGDDGANPAAGLVLSGNTLYGTTKNGGPAYAGTVFAISTGGKGFTNLYQFDHASDGVNPGAALILSNGILYGTTPYGGKSQGGTIFAVNTNGSNFTNIFNFPVGGPPEGDLVLSDNILYGTRSYGGALRAGTLFRINIDGTGFTNIYSFLGPIDGANPLTGMVLSGNTLYGTTSDGGNGGSGTVFSFLLSPAIPPQLTALAASSGIVLMWPTNATGVTVQSSTNLSSWTAMPATPVVLNGQNVVTNPISGSQMFFRLAQ